MSIKSWFEGAGRTLKSGFQNFGNKVADTARYVGHEIATKALPVLEKISDGIHQGAGYVSQGLGMAMPVLGMIPGIGQVARIAQGVAGAVGAGTGLASSALHAVNNPSQGNIIGALRQVGTAVAPALMKSAVVPYGGIAQRLKTM